METKPSLNVVCLTGHSIFQQLQLEEALLRADSRNWCILNSAVEPSIVMGISGKVEELINLDKISAAPIPVIRRFSGGGTVYVDQNTYFVSFIVQNTLLNAPSYPHHIHEWAKQFYTSVFQWEEFQLRENDYVLGDQKFGGNAQYICKNRILHHTTFLWDFDPIAMEYLLLPKKIPKYRQSRMHKDFLCRLKQRMETKEQLHEGILQALNKHYNVQMIQQEALDGIQQQAHRQATCIVDLPNTQKPL